MTFNEFGIQNEKILMLLPGTACTWQINFCRVKEELEKHYHLICVNYDGFDGDSSVPFPDMITVTEKIEKYIMENHNGRVDGAYGSSLGGSFVGLLIQRKNIHIDHGFIGSSDLDQGNPIVAKIATKIIGGAISGAAESPKKKDYREHIEETMDVLDFTKKTDAVYFSKRVNRFNNPGSTIINDVSARNLQFRHQQWYLGKSLDGYTPMGPCIVTADEIADAHSLDIACYVNGDKRQNSNTKYMITSVEEAISELSQAMTLKAGTVIATGTPGGVAMGMKPPIYLKKGDVVKCEISGIGEIINTIG